MRRVAAPDPRPRVLFVEDERSITEPFSRALAREGFDPVVAHTAAEAMARFEEREPDIVLLDISLPDGDGRDICREFRRRSDVPIIMLTARGTETDRIVGLEIGADDYVAKPFSPNELVARIRALMRRSRRGEVEQKTLRFADLVMDIGRHTVTDGGREVKLTAKEFMLLQYLLEHKGRVLSRDLLLSDVWGYRYTGGTRTVDVHVRRLREKMPTLEDALVTVKQFGYKLEELPSP